MFCKLHFAKGSVLMKLDHGTPLHSACESGSVFQVEWLVEHNAALNSVNDVSAFVCKTAFSSFDL